MPSSIYIVQQHERVDSTSESGRESTRRASLVASAAAARSGHFEKLITRWVLASLPNTFMYSLLKGTTLVFNNSRLSITLYYVALLPYLLHIRPHPKTCYIYVHILRLVTYLLHTCHIYVHILRLVTYLSHIRPHPKTYNIYVHILRHVTQCNAM